MDSLPQELLDKIIDNLPQPGFLFFSYSLVARRWRRRCQQRAFDTISFSSEGNLNRWWTNIPQDVDGIPSYVRFLKIEYITTWDDPALFARVFKNFTSLTILFFFETGIPDELPGLILRGEFGKGITALYIWSSFGPLATTMSTILSLPSLKKLWIKDHKTTSGEPLSTHPATPPGRPLDSLILQGRISGVAESLTKSRVISRHLSLDMDVAGIEQLITISSITVVGLSLYDVSVRGTAPAFDLPSLPALNTLSITLRVDNPSHYLIKILRSIFSAPLLTTIFLTYYKWIDLDHPSGSWENVDRCLVGMAERTGVEGGLSVILRQWPEGKAIWGGFLHEFREAGGEVKTDSYGWFR